MRIAYFVQDLVDPAVSRRIAMLRQGGAEIVLFGFCRADQPPAEVGGVAARSLGRSRGGRLAARAALVLRRRLSISSWAADVRGVDLVIARNLEMLVLAAAARDRFAPGARLIYELLDIHGSLLGDGPASVALRRLERGLLEHSAGVIVSSPAFERDYLARFHSRPPPGILVENKVFAPGGEPPERPALTDGPPWRIGWFGVIRCRRSLECLADLVRRHPGQIEVDIRGQLVEHVLGESMVLIESTPGLRYHGPYDYFTDLPAIYGAVHFVWAIDFFEAGKNSAMLLPNRLYEGGLHGAVPIALESVETGRWLAGHGMGIVLPDPVERSAEAFLAGVTPELYRAALQSQRSIGRSNFIWTTQDSFGLVDRLKSLGPATG